LQDKEIQFENLYFLIISILKTKEGAL